MAIRAPAAVLALLLAAAGAAAAGERVDDFALLDHRGRFHRLYDQRDARAVVLFVHGAGCPIARGAVPVLNALRSEWRPRGVVFWGLNANPQDDRGDVAAEVEAYGLELPVLLDETQLVSESLGIERTAEVLLIDPGTWRVVWRGPVDDRLDYGAERPATRHYLREALEAHRAGRAVEVPRRASPGCLIFFPHADREDHARISYARRIAPILRRRCAPCHRTGGVAPWAMTGYGEVRGWSPMIREVVRTRRMPPWHADPHVGRFANDASLPPDEARDLVHWIEAGAPRGGGPDPLAEAAEPAPRWPLGEPDLVLEVPAQEIPASGVLPYRYETVEVPLERDVWIRAADLRPSNAQVMHHGTVTIVPPDGRSAPPLEGPRFAHGLFAAYVPGRQPVAFPDDGGFLLPRGARLRFELHYNATGRPERDAPRLGLYLSDEAPAHELRIGAAANFSFEIPPGAPEHEARAVRRLERDVVVYAVTPHMHYRGKRMAIEAHAPDGGVRTLVSVPDYHFGWQRRYVLEEPVRLAAGTRIVGRAAFDNSAANPANPDPTRAVGWGLQSTDEMLIAYFLYRELPGAPPPAQRAAAGP